MKKEAAVKGVYSPQTLKSLEAHDEDQINYKLFESAITYIAENCGPGAIISSLALLKRYDYYWRNTLIFFFISWNHRIILDGATKIPSDSIRATLFK